jgi:hypothetical protein
MTSNTEQEQELKKRCDAIGRQLLDLLQEQASDLPRGLCLSIIFGTASALAFTCKVPKETAVEMVLQAYYDLEKRNT